MAYFVAIAAMVLLAIVLTRLTRSGLMQRLSTRPAVILCVAVAAGCLYQLIRLPEIEHDMISRLAAGALAALAFIAGLQFRVSKLMRQSPAALRLATIAGPLFLIAAAVSAFIMMPSLSIWSALLIGGSLMLNGAAIDRRAITSSSAPGEVKTTVELESAAALVIGLPLVIIIELLSDAPFSASNGVIETGVFRAAIGFGIGGAIGLVSGRLCKRYAGPRGKDDGDYRRLVFAYGSGIAAFLLAPLLQGEAIIAAGAAGLIWSEEGCLSAARRRDLRQKFDHAIKPVAYAVFGFILGPSLLQADILIILFSIGAITVLRIGPRLIALSSLGMNSHQQAFLAWFGGAPGAASALYLIKLMGISALMDQEMVLTIGTTCVFIAIIGTRLSSRPLASYFVRQNALARKRRFYTS